MSKRPWNLLPHLVLPICWLVAAGDRVLGNGGMDLLGHLFNIVNASMGEATRTTLIGWPTGVDLLAINGGWADIFLKTPFEGGRHLRRINKIHEHEK